MGDWLTVDELKTDTANPAVSRLTDNRLELYITQVEAQAKALGLATSRAGFSDAAKAAVLSAVEAAVELAHPRRSETKGRRSATYDRNAVVRVLRSGLAGYITGGTIQLVRCPFHVVTTTWRVRSG